MKYPAIIFLFSCFLFGSQNYTVKPTGKVQLRYENRTKELNPLGQFAYKTNEIKYNDYIIGGTFGINTLWNNYSLNSVLYGVARLHDKNDDPLKNEKSFYNNDTDGFIYLGELNIKKDFDKHSFTLGRQAYNTSLVNANYRITQNSYEGLSYRYNNNDINIQSLYFYKMASSTIANNVPYNHKYGFLGYGLGYNTSGFTDISQHVINQDVPSSGALDLLVKYGQKEKYISLENLYVDNFFNTSDLIIAYNFSNLYLKAGAISQVSVGDDYIEKYIESSQQGKKLKSQHYQMEVKYKFGASYISYIIARTPYNGNHIYNGTLYSPFSNKASWVYGLYTDHATIADTTSQRILFSRKTRLYKMPLGFAISYLKYNIGQNNGLSPDPLKTSELLFHTRTFFSKNLSTLIQYAYVKNHDPLMEKSYNTRVALEYKF